MTVDILDLPWIDWKKIFPTFIFGVDCLVGLIQVIVWPLLATVFYRIFNLTKLHFISYRFIGLHFLCWISGVVPFNTWLISSWEENKCCYKLSKCTKWHLFHSKWLKLSFWVKSQMTHWRCRATEDTEFWITCKPPAFLSNFSWLQLIQNSAHSLAWRSQCDIWIVVILSVSQLVTTVIFFSAWDKSRVKRDNSQNSTQKMRISDK